MHYSNKKQRTHKRIFKKRKKLRIKQHSVFLAFILYGRPFMKFSDKFLGKNMSQFFGDFLPIFPKELPVFVTLASQLLINFQLNSDRDYLTTIPVPPGPFL